MPPVVLNLIDRLYGKPCIRNVLRGELVEQMILDTLGPDWRDAGDYQNWDIEHRTAGWRIQVKQGAAMQSWHDADARPSVARFGIAASAGYSEQRIAWGEPRARRCDIYVFAWHPLCGPLADDRVPEQWEFYVVPTAALPPRQKSAGLSLVRKWSDPIRYNGLGTAIEGALR